jgi:hypothetical protein
MQIDRQGRAMSLYEIVFSGEIIPGTQRETVQSNLARLFQADERRVALLFSGRRLMLKNGLNAAAAEKYRATLERAGAVAQVLPMVIEAEVEEIEMAAAPAPIERAAPVRRAQVVPRDAYMAAFAEVDAPDFAMAQAGAALQEEKPQVPAPRLDLSQFSLAPAGADMGQVRQPVAPQAPDTSHLKVIS